MDGKRLFVDCNPSKFIIFSSLFVFSIVLSLKLDGIIYWNNWCIFAPLFIWKASVLVGALMGCIAWSRHPESRVEGYIEFHAMLIAAGIHSLLLFFEILVCLKLETNFLPDDYGWVVCFFPILVLCPLSVAACIWGFKHDRSLELETVISSNVLLFIFIALKLDNVIDWQWKAVFIPLWVVMCLPGIVALYYVIWALLFLRQPQYTSDRKTSLTYATIWLLVVIPLIAFEVLLSFRLDGDAQLEYMSIFTPLHVCLFTLMLTSCGGRGGNRWWCGMRSDFCTALLRTCSCLTLYGNIYVGEKDDSSTSDASSDHDPREELFLRDPRTFDVNYSIIKINVPD